jgi:hypothetical protein
MSSSNKPEIVFKVGGVPVEEVSFGIVPAGSEKYLSVQVTNNGPVLTGVKISTDSDQVEVIDAPESLGDGFLILRYAPPEHAEKGLKTKIYVDGTYVV